MQGNCLGGTFDLAIYYVGVGPDTRSVRFRLKFVSINIFFWLGAQNKLLEVAAAGHAQKAKAIMTYRPRSMAPSR